MEQLGSHSTDFEETFYLRSFRKSPEKIQLSLKSDKNNGHFTRRLMHNYDILLNYSYNEKCFRQKLYRKSKHTFWCDFDRVSSLICGNRMPTRCNRGIYCRSYCLLNIFRAPLCPSSGAQEYYTVLHLVGILFPHINDDARSKSHQKSQTIYLINQPFNYNLSMKEIP